MGAHLSENAGAGQQKEDSRVNLREEMERNRASTTSKSSNTISARTRNKARAFSARTRSKARPFLARTRNKARTLSFERRRLLKSSIKLEVWSEDLGHLGHLGHQGLIKDGSYFYFILFIWGHWCLLVLFLKVFFSLKLQYHTISWVLYFYISLTTIRFFFSFSFFLFFFFSSSKGGLFIFPVYITFSSSMFFSD